MVAHEERTAASPTRAGIASTAVLGDQQNGVGSRLHRCPRGEEVDAERPPTINPWISISSLLSHLVSSRPDQEKTSFFAPCKPILTSIVFVLFILRTVSFNPRKKRA
ncbi:hypothetical protein OPV22_004936 [Ensete ventricosum]|uniref:Uncharacterized protein n=1 Tax=Ensete ventricosum TaxID=4639 RepID=A0AAV8RN00_ENSVE|nr:hypothetical protein OPV22_004936 [Ensete ventricosum]